jgi:hypothetical protein
MRGINKGEGETGIDEGPKTGHDSERHWPAEVNIDTFESISRILHSCSDEPQDGHI